MMTGIPIGEVFWEYVNLQRSFVHHKGRHDFLQKSQRMKRQLSSRYRKEVI